MCIRDSSLPLAQRLKPGASDKPRGLVLVPTRELAVQVNAVLRPLAKAVGLRVVPVYGGVSMEPQKTAYEILRCLVGSEMCIRDRPSRRRCDRSAVPTVAR